MQQEQLLKAKKLMFDRLQYRNPYRIFSINDILFKSLLNIILITVNSMFHKEMSKNFYKWEELKLNKEIGQVQRDMQRITIIMIVCFLSNCLLIVPRTNCLQRKLRINIVRIFFPFQIGSLSLTLLFFILIKSHS